MGKQIQKALNDLAQQFIKKFRQGRLGKLSKNNKKQDKKQLNSKIINVQKQQNSKMNQEYNQHLIASQSQIEAQQLFGKLDPASPIIPKKIQIVKPIKKDKKQKLKQNIKQSKQSNEQEEQQKINPTKSILLKGKLTQNQKNQSKIQIQQQQNSQQQIQEQMQEQKQQKKKEKRVTFIGILPLNTQIEKKWKDPIQNQKKGKFDSQQNKILSQAVGQFLVANNITLQQFQNQLNAIQKSQKFSKKNKIFALMSTALPNRSPQSCYKYLKRNFNTMNRKGKWSQQQINKLKALVQKYGRKWSLISKQLKRTADNCYDKFRELGQQNMQQRIKGQWTFRELVQLLKIIQKMTKLNFLNKSIDKQLQNQKKHDERQAQDIIHKKYNSKNFIFHNITTLKPFLNVKNFQKIDISKIKWNQISANLKTRNILDCRNKLIQLLQVFFHSSPKQLDQQIVSFLILNKYQNDSQVNWKLWKNKETTGQQAKNRFMILRKMIQGRSIKPFKTVVNELKQKLSKKQQQISRQKQKKNKVQ